METEVRLGSLFSGSGGFELAGVIAGMKPVWSSEIEPFPILVTTKHFPDMKHFGDIKKMDGRLISKVDIITGGSPCQDMSIAGKRIGLGGSRSNLFREQIRIVKEMRESDKANERTGKEVRPRFMVWENVPGAFSSNKGEDFRCVLEEICRVADAKVSIPRPPKNKWEKSGTIMADGYSVAWRTLDAQYWGVPQRRKRIYLVADFGGVTAPEILFEQDSLQRNPDKSKKEREGTAGNTQKSFENANTGNVNLSNITAFHITQDPISMKISPCLTAGNPKTGQASIGVVIPISDKATKYKGGGDKRNNDGSSNRLGMGQEGAPSYTLTTADHYSVVYAIDRAAFNQGQNAKYAISIQEGISQTLVARGPGAIAHDVGQKYIVRRITPTECCRLQGFPEGWADNVAIDNPTEDDMAYWEKVFREYAKALGISRKEKTDKQIRKWLQNPESDSAKYKMWGNGIALPCAIFVMEGIARILRKDNKDETNNTMHS